MLELNADLGEGGAHDDALLALVDRANIACGGHAGDARSMAAAVAAALRQGVRIGAHPGFEDRAHFGRRALDLPLPEVQALITRQVRALQAVAAAQGARLDHVKPHGALYNQAADDPALADAIAAAVKALDPSLMLVGLAGSVLIDAAQRHGLRALPEAFADRGYDARARLRPRGEPGAVLDQAAALAQATELLARGRVAVPGGWCALRAQTLCVHGDGPQALALLHALRGLRAGCEGDGA